MMKQCKVLDIKFHAFPYFLFFFFFKSTIILFEDMASCGSLQLGVVRKKNRHSRKRSWGEEEGQSCRQNGGKKETRGGILGPRHYHLFHSRWRYDEFLVSFLRSETSLVQEKPAVPLMSFYLLQFFCWLFTLKRDRKEERGDLLVFHLEWALDFKTYKPLRLWSNYHLLQDAGMKAALMERWSSLQMSPRLVHLLGISLRA